MRDKEFNNNKVLEDCISLFWTHGFGSCAIKDIVTKTKVNRFSLYQEFENKEGILEHSLALYQKRYSNPKIELLHERKAITEVLTNFFMSFMEDSNQHPSGCYVIHISTELADSNPTIKAILDTYLKRIENQLLICLRKHDETKENSSFLAKHFTGLFCTLTCFCVIHSFEERKSLVKNGINMLLKKHSLDVTNP